MSSILPRIVGIYKIHCLADGKSYIGSSSNIKQRWKSHRNELKGNRHRNSYLQNAWNKYGESAFEFTVLEEISVDSLLEREEYWITELKTYDRALGFNRVITPTAPNRGIPLSAETKQKLSIAFKGRVFSPEHRAKMSIANTGRYYSPETREKIAIGASKAMKGRTKSPEHRAKIAEGNRGKTLSAETRAKISLARTGKTYSPLNSEHKAKISAANTKDYLVTSPDGQVFYVHGLVKFCEEHGLLFTSMSSVASGKRPHHKGWLCRHAD